MAEPRGREKAGRPRKSAGRKAPAPSGALAEPPTDAGELQGQPARAGSDKEASAAVRAYLDELTQTLPRRGRRRDPARLRRELAPIDAKLPTLTPLRRFRLGPRPLGDPGGPGRPGGGAPVAGLGARVGQVRRRLRRAQRDLLRRLARVRRPGRRPPPGGRVGASARAPGPPGRESQDQSNLTKVGGVCHRHGGKLHGVPVFLCGSILRERSASKRRATVSAELKEQAGSVVPTVRGLPLIGSALDLKRDLLGAYLEAMREHGDVARFVAGPPGLQLVFYVVFHPDGVQRVLAGESGRYRKDNRFYRELRAAIGDGLLTSQDDRWRRQKRFVQPLFTRHRTARYVAIMAEEAAEVGRRLRELEAGNAAVDLNSE